MFAVGGVNVIAAPARGAWTSKAALARHVAISVAIIRREWRRSREPKPVSWTGSGWPELHMELLPVGVDDRCVVDVRAPGIGYLLSHAREHSDSRSWFFDDIG